LLFTFGKLPEVFEDENPLLLNYKKMEIYGLSLDIVWVVKDDKSLDRDYKFNVNILEDMRPSVEIALTSIKNYNTKICRSKIPVPKQLLNIQTTVFQTQFQFSDNSFKDLKTNEKKFLEYLIDFGYACKLYDHFAEMKNKIVLEYYLQTAGGYIPENTNDLELLDLKCCRNCIRHFEDNLDTMAVPIPIEQLYIQYALKWLRFNVEKIFPQCL